MWFLFSPTSIVLLELLALFFLISLIFKSSYFTCYVFLVPPSILFYFLLQLFF